MRPTPRDIHHQVEKNGMTLGLLRKAIPTSLFSPVPLRSWMTLLRILSMIAVCLWLETKTNYLLFLFPLWILHGFILVGLFVLAHDCGHGSFSRNRLTNTIVGHLAFAPLGNGLVTWQLTHNHHHAHTQKRGQEVDWSKWLRTREEFASTKWSKNPVTRLGYSLPFGILLWVGVNAILRGLRKSQILGCELSSKQLKAVNLSNLFMLAMMSAIYLGIFLQSGFWGVLKYHAIPAFIAMLTGYLLLIIQHANVDSLWYEDQSWSPAKGQLAATFDERFPLVLEWLWLDINIHVPHHVAPNIPWYHLREASAALKKAHPEYYQERAFALKSLTWMLRTPFLQKNPELNTYSLS